MAATRRLTEKTVAPFLTPPSSSARAHLYDRIRDQMLLLWMLQGYDRASTAVRRGRETRASRVLAEQRQASEDTLGAVTDDQRAAAVIGIRGIQGSLASDDIGEVDRVIAVEPGDRARELGRPVECQCPGRAVVEADSGVRGGPELKAAPITNISPAGAHQRIAGDRALDDEPARPAGP